MRNYFMPLENSVATFAATVLLVCLASCRESLPPEEDNKAFVLSETMLKTLRLDTVRVSQVQGVLDLTGKIMADENRQVEIFPIVGGNILSVSAELGDYVQKNQVLGIIHSSEVAEYDRQLTEAQSDVLVAQKNLSVKQDLFNSKLASEREIVAAQKELEKAEASLRRIQETFSIYGFNERSEYYLRAPISGFIISKKISPDMTLPASHDESVFTIAELNAVWAVANVYESDIAKIKQGMDVAITTLSYPDEVIAGKIDKILNVLDPDTKTMKIRVRLDNRSLKLKPEMIANARIVYSEAKELPSVPASALIFDNSRQFVMVFKDRYNIETREVEVHKTTEAFAWINQGLRPGEIVISQNQLFIYDALND